MAEKSAGKKTSKTKTAAKKAVKKKTTAKKATTAKSAKTKTATKATVKSETKTKAADKKSSATGNIKKKTKMAAKSSSGDGKRFTLIQQEAYYIAEKRGFVGGDPEQDWLMAEKQVDEMLKQSSSQ